MQRPEPSQRLLALATLMAAVLMALLSGLDLARAGPVVPPADLDGLRVSTVVDPRDHSPGIRAEMEVQAPPATVWAVLVDCDTAPQHVPGMQSCKILNRDPGGRWDVREHRVRLPWFPLILRNVVRSDYEPERRLSYRRADPDARRLDGEWRLTAVLGGAATRIDYVGHATGVLPIPTALLRTYVIEGLEAVRTESVRRVGQAVRLPDAQP
jgi:uncharacterized protein YndB with AHSA1/START domain